MKRHGVNAIDGHNRLLEEPACISDSSDWSETSISADRVVDSIPRTFAILPLWSTTSVESIFGVLNLIEEATITKRTEMYRTH